MIAINGVPNMNEDFQNGQAAAKREYQSPKLQMYGDVRTLTQSKGDMGPLDGGMVVPFHRSMA
jgi:hypothetical protein